MSKQEMISAVMAKLTSIGILAVTGGTADVTINQEFIDASWKTGNKKINYQASAYFAENEGVIYLWELTKEQGSGFSFGGNSDSEFQSGKTLFRKMKSVQYGPEGKVYEFDLDLGAIPKAFKDAAKQYGWKFKQVLRKAKASYPPGMVYTAPAPQVQQPVQQPAQVQQPSQPVIQTPPPVQTAQPYYPAPQQSMSQDAIHEKRKNIGGSLFLFIFILLTLATLIFMLIGENTYIGWIIAGVALLFYFITGRKVAKKSCLLQIVLFVIVAIIIFFAIGLTVTLKP